MAQRPWCDFPADRAGGAGDVSPGGDPPSSAADAALGARRRLAASPFGQV